MLAKTKALQNEVLLAHNLDFAFNIRCTLFSNHLRQILRIAQIHLQAMHSHNYQASQARISYIQYSSSEVMI